MFAPVLGHKTHYIARVITAEFEVFAADKQGNERWFIQNYG